MTEATAYARRLGGLGTLVIIGGAGHGIDTGTSSATQHLWADVVRFLAAHRLASSG